MSARGASLGSATKLYCQFSSEERAKFRDMLTEKVRQHLGETGRADPANGSLLVEYIEVMLLNKEPVNDIQAELKVLLDKANPTSEVSGPFTNWLCHTLASFGHEEDPAAGVGEAHIARRQRSASPEESSEASSRSRTPPGSRVEPEVSVAADIAAAHGFRRDYVPPRQSKFRVAALLRFKRTDGSTGTIGAVNAEPHDANIRGAICAERAALCRFQQEEEAAGSQVVRVVCATDATTPIFPGPLCREFLTATCDPEVEVVAACAAGEWLAQPLRQLLPLPSLYRRGDQDSMKVKGARLGADAKPPVDGSLAKAYAAAVCYARRQQAQAQVFPVLFAAAVYFGDGRVKCMAELKGIEYGCTVDAVTLLLPDLLRNREAGNAPPTYVLQADQFGLAHAPFAAARSLLLEHSFGDVKVCAHDDDGKWTRVITIRESLPHSNFTELFS